MMGEERDTLKIIEELMKELHDHMQYGSDDFEERLGRKPNVEVVKMGLKKPDMEGAEEMAGADLDGDNEEGESMEHKLKVLGGGEGEDDLKGRLMGLRKRMM